MSKIRFEGWLLGLSVWGLGLGVHVESCAQVDLISSALVDSSRSNRVIPLDIKVPSDAIGELPWVVMGHGFAMPTSDYDDLSGGLVEAGYAVVLVATETGFAPSHMDFGLDLAYVVNHTGNDAPGLEGLLSNRVALVGHSMGGGASWLAAAELGASLDALIGLAPAETSPSAVEAGSSIEAATLVISGSLDAITLPEWHHWPLHDSAVESECKAFVNLIDGSHCGFADSGTLCDLAEIGFSGMARPDQQAHSLAMMEFWLDAYLKDEGEPLTWMVDYAEGQTEVEVLHDCEGLATVAEPFHASWILAPNPARDRLRVLEMPDGHGVRAADLQGRMLPMKWLSVSEMDVSEWPRGGVVLFLESPTELVISRSTVLLH